MINSKTLLVFSEFTNKDWNDFLDLVSSPLYNKNAKLVKATEFLFIIYKQKNNDVLFNPKELYEFLFPDKEYNASTIRNLLSDLFILQEEFALWQSNKHNRGRACLQISDWALRKKWQPIMHHTLKQAKQIIDNTTEIDVSYYQTKYEYLQQFYYSIPENHDETQLLVQICETLISYTSLELINRYANIKNRHQTYRNVEITASVEDKMKKLIDILSEGEIILLDMYKKLIKIRTNPKQEDLNWLIELSRNGNPTLTKNDRLVLMIELVNFAINNYANGYVYKGHTPHSLSRHIIEVDLIKWPESTIHETFFRGLIWAACHEKQEKWAIKFRDKYEFILPQSIKNEFMLSCNARILFNQKQYDESLDQIMQSPNLVSSCYYLIKILTMMIYYEKRDFTSLDLCASSFIKTVNKANNPLPKHQKGNFIHFAKVVKLLAKACQNPNSVKLEKIAEHVAPGIGLSNRIWVQEKILELTGHKIEVLNPLELE